MSVDPSQMDFTGDGSIGGSYTLPGDDSSMTLDPGATDTSVQAITGLDPTEVAIDTADANSSSGSNASSNSSGSSSNGALGKALAALGLGGGDNSNKAIASALVGLLSAAGQYKTASSASKLPALPTLPGMSTAGANASSAGYGPQGGYGYQNYNTAIPGAVSTGTSSSTSGLGYAPRTQAPAMPASSYYTYGQGPQAQFFQQVNPSGGAITPLTTNMAKGGRVSTPQRYDQGGFALAPTNTGQMPTQQQSPAVQRPVTPAQPAPTQPAVRPTPPVNPVGSTATQAGGALSGMAPHMSPGPQIRPQTPMPAAQRPQMPTLMGQRMQAARGMAAGGAAHNPDGSAFNLGPINMAQSQLMGVQPSTNLASVRQNVQRRPAMASGGALSSMGAPGPGVSRHIKGAGDGTSDSIPARLANGEYVIDAQAVSMLGNGDNGAGAKKLDEFRKNLRQHKGGALSKGQMAPDAKPVEQYMGGKK